MKHLIMNIIPLCIIIIIAIIKFFKYDNNK